MRIAGMTYLVALIAATVVSPVFGSSPMSHGSQGRQPNPDGPGSRLPSSRSASDRDDFWSPRLPGPYDVGVTSTQVSAPHRLDPIDCMIWYPAEPPTGSTPYVYNEEAGDPMSGVAVLDAPVTNVGELFPVAIFSHGFGAVNYQSIFLTEHLASHGYVVVAPNHPRNNFYDLKLGGFWLGFFQRPMDIWSVLDAIEEWQVSPDSFLQARMDLDRIGMSGHSFGGYTTLAISGARLNLDFHAERCAQTRDEWSCGLVEAARVVLGVRDGLIDLSDDRVRASAPLAPLAWSPFREEGLRYVSIPIQVHGGDRDQTVNAQDEAIMVWYYAQEPKSFLEIYDAGHFTYSDVCLFAPRFNQCRPPFIDMDIAHELINTYVTSHFKVFLEEDMRYAEFLSESYAQEWSEYAAWYEALGL